jgi:hypothetical protein
VCLLLFLNRKTEKPKKPHWPVGAGQNTSNGQIIGRAQENQQGLFWMPRLPLKPALSQKPKTSSSFCQLRDTRLREFAEGIGKNKAKWQK